MIMAFLLSPIGRGVLSGGIVVATFAAWLWTHDQKVEQRVVTSINNAAETLSEKAVENRARGDIPDALAKLRKRACRDCER